jgi:serine/threonine-protein kinase
LRTIGSWVLERRLGDGAFASVWLGRHAVLEGRRAIKVMHPQWVTNDRIRQRFLAEGRILARIEHKNIVEVIDLVDEPPDTLALVMDFIDGVDLETRLQRGDLRDEEILPILHGLLDGLAHAHRVGIVHRDLKPANLLLRADGTPVLLDFGIARVTDTSEVATQHVGATRVQVRMGTPEYMAPELVISATAATPRSDLWAIGCIAFECLTQTPCFQGANSDDVYAAVVKGRHAPLDEVPSAWRPWIERLLSREPEDRPQTCAEALATMPGSIVRDAPTASPSSPAAVAPVRVTGGAAGTVDVLLAPSPSTVTPARSNVPVLMVAAGVGVLTITALVTAAPDAAPSPGGEPPSAGAVAGTDAAGQVTQAGGGASVAVGEPAAKSVSAGSVDGAGPAPSKVPTAAPASVPAPASASATAATPAASAPGTAASAPSKPAPAAAGPALPPAAADPASSRPTTPAATPVGTAPASSDASSERNRLSAGVEAMWKVLEPRLRACGGPATAERQPWRVEVRVAGDGKLQDVQARGTDPTGTMAACIENVVRGARFPATGADQQRTFNVSLSPKSSL